MKLHPLVAASVLLPFGVAASGAHAILEHRRARARRPPPPPEVDEPAPSRPAPAAAPRASRPPPATAPPAAPGAAVRVRVTGPHGLAAEDVDVAVHRRGDDDDTWTDLAEEDAAGGDDDAARAADPAIFAATDLPAGRYDVRVEAEGMRTARLADVRTDGVVLDVVLARRAALLGAVGALGAADCEGVSVRWSDASGEEAGDADLDGCTFVAEGLPDGVPVTFVATRGERSGSALVTAPLTGDPTPLCLAPPCAELPVALLVHVVDADRHELGDATLEWTLAADETGGISTGGAPFWVRGRRAGETLALRASASGRVVDATVVVGAGVTETVLAFPPASATAGDDLDAENEAGAPRGLSGIRATGAVILR